MTAPAKILNPAEQLDAYGHLMALARNEPDKFVDLSIAVVEGHRVHKHMIHKLVLDSLNCCMAAGKHCVLVLPPESGKTTTLIPWLIWQRGKRDGLRIGITSADIDLAQKNLTRFRKTILHPQTQTIFPHLRPDESQSKARGEWSKQRLYLQGDVQPGFEAYPFEGAAEGTRVDLLWLDDVITRSCKESQADRERTHGVIHGTWLNRITGNGIAIFTNNVWHREDSIHKASQSPAFHTLWVGYNGTDSMYWRCHNPAEGWPHGEGGTLPLWKPVWPKERLESKQAADRLFYKQMFGGKAMLAEECLFPPSDQWARYTFDELKAAIAGGARIYAFLDPSGGRHVDKGDYAAHVVVAIGKDRTIYVLDAWVRRAKPAEQVERIWTADAVCLRALGRQIQGTRIEVLPKESEWIIPPVLEKQRAMRAKGQSVAVYPWNPPSNTHKNVFISSLVTPMEQGFVKFPKDMERLMGHASGDWRQLVNQIEDFPLGDHDDAPDALSKAVKMAEEMGPDPDWNHDRFVEQIVKRNRGMVEAEGKKNRLTRRNDSGGFEPVKSGGWTL